VRSLVDNLLDMPIIIGSFYFYTPENMLRSAQCMVSDSNFTEKAPTLTNTFTLHAVIPPSADPRYAPKRQGGCHRSPLVA